MKLQFLGGTGTVTGSKYLITYQDKKILVDCGLYQGVKNVRLRNWQQFPVNPAAITAIILTHAHLDHSGYIPALIKHGFSGPIYCTKATLALCNILLPDSGFLQEEDARYANKYKFSKHHPALPLYTEAEARDSLKLFVTKHYHETFELVTGLQITFNPVGHILGSSALLIKTKNCKILFSGDVGRNNDIIMQAPEPIKERPDYVVVESTYGDRRHEETDPYQLLEVVINQTVKHGGIILIPAFAVGRTQTVLYIIHQLKAKKAIPDIPVYLNSPMAISATEVFCQHYKEHKLSKEECHLIDKGTHFIRTAEESIALNNKKFPAIIISASGMASGGRVLHHLKTLVSHQKNSVVFVGFQAPGTRGDAMTHGATQIKIHGQYYPIKASVYHLDSLSAHGDYYEILHWLNQLTQPPKMTFVTHGEPVAADAMRLHIQDDLGWPVRVPDYLECVSLK
ncbi:MBL fold metallo-hydrolase [Endozoicomonas sp. SM1973]|uniref:MBL fold metallo-hydrolase n=1 Tax=Spartinivicinus marinus TaxID=2994442 RepID=A0A853IA72_9GAMM|nr:MBL fold metallo-hydrolase [Spartinivicinus marinus]MCX4029665.1 MBL fold metallo-hydrolase [Spartinivicinus marinus]NYZ66954.1 MBL fold metallo-hydrolase [Spartinivicinus marinus]